jgi:hypothetical protein
MVIRGMADSGSIEYREIAVDRDALEASALRSDIVGIEEWLGLRRPGFSTEF